MANNIKVDFEREDARNNRDFWINKGKELIYPELQLKWVRCVDARIEELYYGRDLSIALDIMEALENDNFDEALKIFVNLSSSIDSAIISNIVLEFSKKGPDFFEQIYKNVYKKEIPEENKELIAQIREENEMYAKIDNYVKKK